MFDLCFVCLLRVKKASNTGFDLLLSFAFFECDQLWQLESACRRLLRLDLELNASKLQTLTKTTKTSKPYRFVFNYFEIH